jgi:hypothetical protein
LSEDSADNRRIARRIPARHGVWCEGPTLTLFTQTINLSANGAFVRAPQPLEPGELVQLRFPDVCATFQTEVMWTRKTQRPTANSEHPGMGVRFLDGEGRDAYEKLLERLADEEIDPITGPRRAT